MREGRHRPRERAEGMGMDSETEGAVDSSESSAVSEGATRDEREGDERGCWWCWWCTCVTGAVAVDERPRAREGSRMTGAALGGVTGRRPVVWATRRATGRPRGRVGGREREAVEGLVERRRRCEWRVMKMADSSSDSEEESDGEPTMSLSPSSSSSSSSWLDAEGESETDSRSLSSSKTLFCSSREDE